MSSAAASFFSCTTCGALDEPACVDYNYPSTTTNTNSSPTSATLKSTNKTNSTASIASTDSQNSITSTTMRRVSSSRREQQSPVLMRSRSTERLGDGTTTTTAVAAVDDDGDLFQDASQNFLAESTDNDSAAELSSGDDNDKAAIPKHSQRSSAAAKRAGYHVRAMSDPFDTQEMQDALQEETTTTTAVVPPLEPAAGAYPTLMRFPVAETRNKNCWSEPPVTIFSVRGPQYFDDKKKQTSGPYLLAARGTDIFLFDTPVRLQDRSHLILGGHLRSVPTLLINFQFPWGVMVLYFEVPAKLAPYMCTSSTKSTMNGNTTTNPKKDTSLSHSEKTLAAWFQGDENYKNDRLKLIPYVAEGPWVVRNMVTGRPAIIGRKLPVTYRAVPAHGHQAPLLEVTLDIGSSSATAKRIVSVCRRYMSGLSADIGFVIQAETAAELPEQMMGCVRVHGPDPLKAPKI